MASKKRKPKKKPRVVRAQVPPNAEELMAAHRAEMASKMARGERWHIHGPASPIWLPCRTCGAQAGEKCRGTARYCFDREDDNRVRMESVRIEVEP